MHLVIDGYEAKYNHLTSTDFVYKFLNEYPDHIGMNKISEPLIHTYRGPVPEDWGLSGFVIIAESHISVHTFPDRDYINIDVFSCKEFDAEMALSEIRRAFEVQNVKSWRLDRGLEHLKPATAKQVVAAEREALRQRG